jgi:hypothetical protein
VGVSALGHFAILDVTALMPKQLAEAVKLFDAMSGMDLLPLHEIDKDPVRKELDNEFARRALHLPEAMLAPDSPLDVLRMKLSREPSIRGRKS